METITKRVALSGGITKFLSDSKEVIEKVLKRIKYESVLTVFGSLALAYEFGALAVPNGLEELTG